MEWLHGAEGGEGTATFPALRIRQQAACQLSLDSKASAWLQLPKQGLALGCARFLFSMALDMNVPSTLLIPCTSKIRLNPWCAPR